MNKALLGAISICISYRVQYTFIRSPFVKNVRNSTSKDVSPLLQITEILLYLSYLRWKRQVCRTLQREISNNYDKHSVIVLCLSNKLRDRYKVKECRLSTKHSYKNEKNIKKTDSEGRSTGTGNTVCSAHSL